MGMVKASLTVIVMGWPVLAAGSERVGLARRYGTFREPGPRCDTEATRHARIPPGNENAR